LQFVVLKWAAQGLGLDLSHAAVLQAVVALGVALGAVLAAARIPLRQSLSVLPYGVAMGATVIILGCFRRAWFPQLELTLFGAHIPLAVIVAGALLMAMGCMAGYFVVPMNALLQHRGYVLMSAGHSIAVQNFSENLSVLTMLCVYAALVRIHLDIRLVILLFGSFVCAVMLLVMQRHRRNERQFHIEALIGETPR
jgi:hypothetical protein